MNKTWPLQMIYVYLVRGCNLACRHCWLRTNTQDETVLDPAILHSVIEQARPLGLRAIKLTGGEPLIHPQILDVLEYLSTKDLELEIETNAVACQDAHVEIIARCKKPFVAISLDGATRESHEWVRGATGCFGATLQGIRRLVKAGIKTQLIMTVMRKNRNEIPAFVALGETLGVHSIKFNIVEPVGRGELLFTNNQTLPFEELLALGTYIEENLAPNSNIPLFFSWPPAFQSLRVLTQPNQGRCAIHTILGLLADGSYALCGIGDMIPELVFGNAAKDALVHVWSHSPLLQEIRDGIPQRLEGICSKCVFKNRCLGYCLAQKYSMTRNLYSPHWFCDMANQIGCFPKNRLKPVPDATQAGKTSIQDNAEIKLAADNDFVTSQPTFPPKVGCR